MSSYLSWVASAVGGARSPLTDFAYTVGEPVATNTAYPSLWTLHNGQKKADKTAVSVFVFQTANNQEALPLIRNAYKRSKTLRHPNLLHFVDGLETDSAVYIVTPHVVPLATKLADVAGSESMLAWGLHQILKGLAFLNEDAGLVHGAVAVNSIYVDDAGEFKLSGLEVVSNMKEEDNALVRYHDQLHWLQKYRPPEVLKSGWAAEKGAPTWAVDVWFFGCLVYELFNGAFSKIEQIKAKGQIPELLYTVYKDIMKGDPKLRLSPSQIIERCSVKGGFFSNEFVQANLFLENFALKEAYEKDQFFRKLADVVDSFPDNFCKYKILPELVNALEFGNAGSKVIAPLMKIGARLTAEEYDAKIVTAIVKMFQQTDRTMRLSLLENLPNVIDHLTPKLISQSIFQHVCTGFIDSQPTMREATIKSMVLFAPKLGSRELDDVMRYFAKTQVDEEPGIRTNTTICLGRMSEHMPEAIKKRVLVSAFGRALKDPFPPARNAGILAFQATKETYDATEIACKIIPALSPLMVDPEPTVRTQAQKTLAVFFKQADAAIKEMGSAQLATSPANKDAKSDAQADGWAGWAVSSLRSSIIGGSNVAAGPAAAASPSTTNAGSTSSLGGGTSKEALDQSAAAKAATSNANALKLTSASPSSPNKSRFRKAYVFTNTQLNQRHTSTAKRVGSSGDGWENDDLSALLDTPPTKAKSSFGAASIDVDSYVNGESSRFGASASSARATSSAKSTLDDDDDDTSAWEPLATAAPARPADGDDDDGDDDAEAAKRRREEQRRQKQAERKKAAGANGASTTTTGRTGGPPRLGAVRKVA